MGQIPEYCHIADEKNKINMLGISLKDRIWADYLYLSHL